MSCWSIVAELEKRSKGPETRGGSVLRWWKKKKGGGVGGGMRRGGGQSCLIFQVYLSANGACGKKMSNKESALPLFWQQSCVHRGLSSDAPRLQKQQNITFLLPPIKGRLWKGGEQERGEGKKGGEEEELHVLKKKAAAKFLHWLNHGGFRPVKSVPPRRRGSPVGLIYHWLLKLWRRRGWCPPHTHTPTHRLTTWFMLE